jgi:hypothetical protein
MTPHRDAAVKVSPQERAPAEGTREAEAAASGPEKEILVAPPAPKKQDLAARWDLF